MKTGVDRDTSTALGYSRDKPRDSVVRRARVHCHETVRCGHAYTHTSVDGSATVYSHAYARFGFDFMYRYGVSNAPAEVLFGHTFPRWYV